MPKRIRTATVIIVTLMFAILLVACGGGGSDSLSYSGEEGAGSLPDGATASEYLTKGYSAFDLTSVLAATLVDVGPEILTLAAEVQPQIIATVVIQERMYGDEDGYFDVDFVWNMMTDYFSGTIAYSDYSDMPGQLIDGTADVDGYGINESGPPDITNLTFSDLSISNWGMDWKASGTMTVDNGWVPEDLALAPLFISPDSEVTIESMVLKDSAGDTYKIEDAWIGVMGGESYHTLFIDATEASGLDGAKFYHPDYGYLFVESMDGLLIANDSGVPMAGNIQIWDESDQYAWLEFVSNGSTHWSVWWDGGNLLLDRGEGDGWDDTLYATGTFDSGVFTVPIPG